MRLPRASADDVLRALLLPAQPPGKHDALLARTTPRPAAGRTVAMVPTGLAADVERRLARLAGVEKLPVAHTDGPEALDLPRRTAEGDFAGRLLVVAQAVAVGALLVVATAAAVAARFGSGGLRIHELPLAGWGLAGAVTAVALAASSAEQAAATPGTRKRWPISGLMLMVSLLVCVTGAVTTAGGVAGPAWVLFLPVVLVTGAVLGPVVGLGVGAAAAVGIYTAAGFSHTLTAAGAGRMLVILPAAPAAGWAAGALAHLARQTAEEAQARRAALEGDLTRLAELLAVVADGDLTTVPAPGEGADPVAQSVAVVFADTLLALRRLVRQLGDVTQQLAGSASEIAASAEQEVGAVETQGAAVIETTSTVEQLAATAGTIAETAVRVSQFAGTTRRDLDRGAGAVHEAATALDRIAQRVDDLSSRAEQLLDRIRRIESATRVIDELARRTTILAVNASIEAARAGEHGTGFATVAHEVDGLATRAREATARITSIVAELEQGASATAEAGREGLQAVAVGSALHHEVVQALSRIATMVDRTTLATRDISEATRMQRAASDAVVTAMATVTVASERCRAGTRRHADAARRLRDLADDSRRAIGRFRVG